MNALLDCGHVPSEHSAFTTGYGKDAEGKTFCYACCADRDKAQMIEDGKTVLYLTSTKAPNNYGGEDTLYSVTNWPGSLMFPAQVAKGRHNIARTRYDAWFIGPDGKEWHGVQYGENTQICHCKRLKS